MKIVILKPKKQFSILICGMSLLPSLYRKDLNKNIPDSIENGYRKGVTKGVKSALDSYSFFEYSELMSRPLRIEYAHAWYHVLNRGRRRESIFRDTKDYEIFLQTVQEACEFWHLRVAAYCLMASHYHLLVQTPNGNLSRCLRHIDGVYTQRFNRRHGHDGPLFRGRYKALLIEADTYLLQLVRYIHRNPLEAGLAKTLDDYPWTSHQGYLSRNPRWKWLYKDIVLEILAANPPERIEAYRKFVVREDSKELVQLFSRKRWPVFLGSEKFIAGVRGRFFSKKADSEIPQRKDLAPDLELLIEVVSRGYRVKRKDLFYSRRGHEIGRAHV